MVIQRGEVNRTPTEELSRVDRVLYLTGDVNFALPQVFCLTMKPVKQCQAEAACFHKRDPLSR